MKLTEKQEDFIRQYRTILLPIVEALRQDYMEKMVDAGSPERDIYALMVKELKKSYITMEQIGNQKEVPKQEKEFTGV